MTARLLLIVGLVAAAASPAGAGGPVYPPQLRTVQDASTVELTTTGRKSGQPRLVTIWFAVDAEGRLYVQSGQDGRTDWYRNLLVTPAVSLRIGELAMRGTATPVDDLTEVARVHQLFREKYLRARITSWFGGDVGHGKVVRIGELTQMP
jgi:deazaflavin-dependent oxidoreductase (nitroreductase family)